MARKDETATGSSAPPPVPTEGGVYQRDPQSGELSRINEAERQDEQA